jgi:hypothetical protein
MDFNQDSSVCPPTVGGRLNIFTMILFYSQFWLNLPMDNHHCWCSSKGLIFYIMKFWSWNSNIQRYKRCLDTKLVCFFLCSALCLALAIESDLFVRMCFICVTLKVSIMLSIDIVTHGSFKYKMLSVKIRATLETQSLCSWADCRFHVYLWSTL